MLAPSSSADKVVNRGRSNGGLAAFFLLVLLVCTACSSTLRPREGQDTLTYTVRPGDTLFALSQTYGVSIAEIKTFNDIGDPRSLTVGQQLIIPKSKYRDYKLSSGDEVRGGVSFTRLEVQQRLKIPLAWPVTDPRILSYFGTRSGSFHEGLDLGADEGTTISAAHDGEVAYSGNGLSGYGKLLVLRGQGFFTVYAHNSALLVSKGASVVRGQPIAEVGQTGRATTPHVHFELRMRNSEGRYQAIDPLPFLSKKRAES